MDRPLSAAEVAGPGLRPSHIVRALYPRRITTIVQRLVQWRRLLRLHLSFLPHVTKREKKQLLSLLVYIRGTRRDISPLYTDLADFAESVPCALLTQLFPASLDDGSAAGDCGLSAYKMLWSPGLRHDQALLSRGVDPRWRQCPCNSSWGRRVWTSGDARGPVVLGPGPADATTYRETTQSHYVVSSSRIARGESGGGTELPPLQQDRQDTMKHLQAQWAAAGIEARLDVVPGAAHEAGKVRG
ncbi:poly hydrolase [Apiospora aurea]|uniref:Poly hydrolase n=1 Tax=Apiospora aurea TaxID=335848 RepID=A0ABR1QTN5_9PEZI